MLKPFILLCTMSTLGSLSAIAGEEIKPPVKAPVTTSAAKPNEATGKITATEPQPSTPPKTMAKWRNPNLDLTPCLNKDSNTAVIKCAE